MECVVESGFNIDTPFNPWTKDSVVIVEDDRITVTVSDVTSRLIIRNLSAADAGQYTCSKGGFPNSTTTITVEVPGMFLYNPILRSQCFIQIDLDCWGWGCKHSTSHWNPIILGGEA